MIDFAYPLRPSGSQCGDCELKYSLRSVEQFMPDIGNVFIATDKLPAFLAPDSVIHVKQGDKSGHRTLNTLAKALAVCAHPECGERVVWQNDDIFLKAPYDPTRYYTRGPHLGVGEYGRAMRETLSILQAHGITDPRNFETHRPVMLNRDQFVELMTPVLKKGVAVAWVSLYLNLIGVESVESYDVKCGTLEDLVELYPVVSSGALIVRRPEVQMWLGSMFPEPSRFERAPVLTTYPAKVRV